MPKNTGNGSRATGHKIGVFRDAKSQGGSFKHVWPISDNFKDVKFPAEMTDEDED